MSAADTTLDGHKNFIPADAEIKHRYCTQFYIETQNSTEELKKTLNADLATVSFLPETEIG